MFIHRSNRVEVLVDRLAARLQAPSAFGMPDPFDREVVLVHSAGMAAWLQQQLARALGVAAQIEFPFPTRFALETFERVLGSEAAGAHQWSRDQLVWWIADALPALWDAPDFEAVRRYVGDDIGGLRHLQLADRVAMVFDGYVAYRPQMVARWSAGEQPESDEARWQARLWQLLRARVPAPDPVTLAARFARAITACDPSAVGLPPRVFAFGISTLPPFTLHALWALSRRIEVHLYVPSPSRQYWADTRSPAEVARRAGDADPDDLYLEVGHPLLATLGRVGRDFHRLLEDGPGYLEPDGDLHVDSGDRTVLHTLQADMLDLVDRRAGDAPRPCVATDDASVRIHACHGPMRQVEVLRDALMSAIAELEGLEPRDIVVMTPALDDYAPLIEAVFDRDPVDPGRLPFHIADRSLRRENPVAEAFLRLLDLAGSRATASSVLDLLAVEPVYARFGLDADDLDRIRTWVDESGIRWGIDADHRAECEQPPYAENTWRFGLDRLLLGHAMTGGGRRLFAGALPYDEIEGQSARIAGRLADFCDVVFEVVRALDAPRSMAAWRDVLVDLLSQIVEAHDQNARQHQEVRGLLADLAHRATTAEVVGELTLDAVRSLVADHFDGGRSSRGFLAGGITFCELLPMRSIPFRVVALVGMDDRAFPRAGTRVGFDLAPKDPQPGDRSPRHDDRYLFLEALLSARDRLIVTYTGRRPTDDRPVPPSVVVSELVDALTGAFDAPRETFVRVHPLQPFSPRNYDAPIRDRSFEPAWVAGAQALARRGPPALPVPFFEAPLAPVARAEAVVVSDLARFFARPIGELLERRLGLAPASGPSIVLDREPLVLDRLDHSRLGQAQLEAQLSGMTDDDALAAVRAQGALPLGVPGRRAWTQIEAEVAPLVAQLALTRAWPIEPDLDVDLVVEVDGAPCRVRGRVGHLRGGSRVFGRFARVKGRTLLGAWVEHLVLALARPDSARTVLVLRAEKSFDAWVGGFAHVDDPARRLGDLIALYWRGLELPLPLFPDASSTYAKHLHDRPGREVAALAEARRKWTPGAYNQFAEGGDAHVRRVYGELCPLDRDFVLGPLPVDGLDFASVAQAVFGPLHTHLIEGDALLAAEAP